MTGSYSNMWGPLLVLALLTTINPVRLGIILLVLTRRRPMQGLLAYWAGALLVGLATLLVPLLVLHSNPSSATFADTFAHPTTNPVAQRTATGIGALLLAIAAVMLVRNLIGTPAANVSRPNPDAGGDRGTSTLVLDSGAPPVITRLLHPARDSADVESDGTTVPRRLLGRIRDSWQNGSPWIPFVIGLVVLPPLDGVVFALAIIVTSGTSFEIQAVAAVLFVLGVLVVEEVILVTNLLAPARTQAALRRLQEWARAHHQKFVAAILAVAGLALVARGLGGL